MLCPKSLKNRDPNAHSYTHYFDGQEYTESRHELTSQSTMLSNHSASADEIRLTDGHRHPQQRRRHDSPAWYQQQSDRGEWGSSTSAAAIKNDQSNWGTSVSPRHPLTLRCVSGITTIKLSPTTISIVYATCSMLHVDETLREKKDRCI